MEYLANWHIEHWHILGALALMMFVVEIFTAAFFSASIGIGLLLAAVGSFIGMGPSWQLLFLACGVGLTYFFIRPLVTKHGYKQGSIKTNRDAIIEKTGVVTEEINSNLNTGRVEIDGVDWKAKALEDQQIITGTTVQVIDVDSIVLYVKQITKK